MHYYETRRLADNIWLILERYAPDNVLSMGLIVGKKRAALIDSGMGVFGDTLRDVVRSLTDKPIVNLLTHGHPDHIAGSVLFQDVYMNERDDSQIPRLAKEKRMGDAAFFSHDNAELLAYAEKHCLDCSGFRYKNIQAGDRIDLGGVILDIYALPGHSAGSIAVMDAKDNICFVGDAFNVSLPCSSLTDLSQFREMADGIQTFCNAVPDSVPLYGGHWETPISWDLVRDEMATALELANGQTEGDEEIYNPISPVPHQKKHTHGLSSITYNPAIVRK